MELQVLLSDMARIMDLPPHTSFPDDGRDAPDSPPHQHHHLHHHHQAQHHAQHQHLAQHQPPPDAQTPPPPPHAQQHHAQQHVQSSMLALLGTAAAAAAAEHPNGPGQAGAKAAAALALWPPSALPPSPPQTQLSPAASGSDAGDVLAGVADDTAADLFWTQELKFLSAANTPRATPPHDAQQQPPPPQQQQPPPPQQQQQQPPPNVAAVAAAAAAHDLKQLFSKAVNAISRKRKAWEGGEDGLAPAAKTPPGVQQPMDGKLAAAQRRRDDAEKKARKDTGGVWPPNVDGLEADLDGSLSALGVDLTSGSYNMGETLLALPSLTVFKQEAPSPSNPDGFQYVLAAATSIATKVNEETLTYLNQGQSYEIKLKKLGELSAFRGKFLKSTIRVCFHERRLQYTEREQMAAWQASRPGDRVVEVDVPLSYGLGDIIQDPLQLNAVEFSWDPTKEVGVYIKVNCISTEFTPKKHGGEKGVPFRIQVETYQQGDGGLKRLHAAACQVKVFKLKGADRKHKQDREKILKRPMVEQEKYQPSYECTVLSDIPSDALMLPQPVTPVVTSSISAGPVYSPTDGVAPGRPSAPLAAAAAGLLPPKEEKPTLHSPGPNGPSPGIPGAGLADQASGLTPPIGPTQISPGDPLPREATAAQAARWLEAQRFTAHLRTFGSFSGADLLRLTREDLVQLCGLADGIRLHNALHAKSIAPCLTLYLCVEEQSPVYRALYLHSLSCTEIIGKLANLVGLPVSQLSDVLLQGPAGIHVLLTDDVIRNVRNESMFMLDVLPDTNHDQYRLLLKPTQR